MSQKIKNPNEKGSGFIVGIIALIAIVAVVIGVVLYMGRNQPIEGLPDEDVSFSVEADGNVVRLASDEAGDDAVVAEVYEDYSCSYCAEMAQGGHADQLEALNNGDLVVEYRMLNFLDGTEPGSPKVKQARHSTKTLAVAYEIAKRGDARLFWNFHTLLMRDQQEAAKWDAVQIADVVKGMGGDDELVSAIRDELDTSEAKAVAEENYLELEKTLGKVSSPHVIVDGKDILENAQAGGLGDWVNLALEAGKA